MPRFYFDVHDNGDISIDDEGMTMPDLKSARDAAIGLLPDIARDVLPNGDSHVFTTKVRDAQNKFVFEATLSLVSKYLP